MSLCINNDLLWISVPRCASLSIENALLKSNLNIKLVPSYLDVKKKAELKNKNPHLHYPINDLYNEFGIKETFCITRNPVERFISGLALIFNFLESKHNTIIKWQDVNNDFIYSHINKIFFDNLNSLDSNRIFDIYKSFLTDDIKIEDIDENTIRSLTILLPQNWFLNNKKCTYEFDINDLQKMRLFIYDRYKVNLDIPKMNETKVKSKIIMDDNLINYLNDLLESPYLKKNNLI